jgi:hypothetical protein
MPLFLVRSGSPVAIRTETENVTMDGFFCYVQELFSPGERLRFLLLLPAAEKGPQPLKVMYLKGTAEVVHMTADGTRCGMGCRLDGYRVLADSALSTTEEILAALIQEECLDTEM